MKISQVLKMSRPIMKRSALVLAVLGLMQVTAQAATITKSATGTDLTDGASWGGTAPTSGDGAFWVSTSLGTGLTLGSSSSWGGIGVASALSNIGITGAGPLTLGAGGIDMNASTVNLTLGTPITLGASQIWIVNSGRTLTSSGIISGTSLGLTKAGLGTLTLTGANTYNGTTTIRGGTMLADTASNPTILNSLSTLDFTGSGTFQLKGLASQTRSQIVNGLTLTGGAAIIDANNIGTSTTIDLRGGASLTITRSAGATVDFRATTGTFGTSAIVNTAQANNGTGILGAWATVNTGADWAINNGSDVAAAYTGYNTLSGNTLASAGTVNYRVATNPTTPTGNITLSTAGTIDVNTLRISDTAARTIDVRNGITQGILRFGAVGGLLTSGGGHTIGVSGIGTAGTITAGGADNTAGELIINNASGLTINSVVANNGSGAVTLVKSGSSTLTLNAVNTHSGGTTINSGTLNLARLSNPLGTTGTITVNAGATFGPNSPSSILLNPITLNGGTIANGNSFGFTSGGLITLSDISTFDTGGTGNMTFTNNVSGTGGLIKTGTSKAPVKFNGLNTYTGPTVVNGGILHCKSSLYNNDPAQWTPANITVASGAMLRVNVGGAGEFTLDQAGALFSSLYTVNNNGLKAGSLIGFDTTGVGSSTVTLTNNFADSVGSGGGSVGLMHLGTGPLELTGVNTYSGPSGTDNNGTLKVSSLNSVSNNVGLGTVHATSSSLGAPTTVANGTITLGSNGTFQGGKLTYTGTGETTDRVISFGGANGTTYTFDQSGSGLLKFVSAFTITDNRGAKTIELKGSTAGTGEIASVIPLGQSSALPNHITKSGTGTWTLSAANLNAGGVFTVNGGTLVLANAEAIPGGIGVSGGLSPLTFNGGVLGLGAGNFTRSLTAAGTITGVNFTGNGGWAAYGADRTVNLGGASASIAWATANTGLNGKILILGATNATHTVDLQNPLDLGAATRTVQVDDGTAAIDGKLSGNLTNGNLTKTGLGTLALTGANTYAGATAVNAGTLLVNGNNSGSGTITAASGATLGGTGSIGGAATFSSGAKAVFTITRNPVTQANTTPLTVTGVMTYNTTEVHLNMPTNLPSGVYTLATSVATPSGSVVATPVVDSGSYAAGFTSAVVSLDTTNNKLLLTVNGLPTNPTQLAITDVNGGVTPTASVAFDVTVQAQDANGTPRHVLANTEVILSVKTGTGALGGTTNGTILAGASSVTISGITYSTDESGVVLTATRLSGDTPLTAGDSAAFTVLPSTAAVTLELTGFPSPQTAGATGSLTVTAKNGAGTTATGYTGTVHFASSAVSAGLPSDYTFVSGDNGEHVFTGVTLNTVGTQFITVTDTVTPTLTGTQSGLIITPATAATLVVSGFPSPQSVGVAGSVTVVAKDAYGNTDTNYTGTIQFTSSDGAAGLPGNYTFVGGDLGVHAFPGGVTLNTIGTQSITATDTLTGTITGTQSGIVVWTPPTGFWWTNIGGGLWNVPGNWTNSTDASVPFAPLTAGQPDYSLNFNLAGTYTTTHNLNSGFLLNQLNFGGATMTLEGNSLVFTNNGAALPQINQNSGAAVTVSTPLNLAANTTFGGTGGGYAKLSGELSGAGSLTKDGAGTLEITGLKHNTYSGGTVLNSGTLYLYDVQTFSGLGTGTVTLNGGELYLNRFTCTNSVIVNGGSLTLDNGYGSSITGPITLNAPTLNITSWYVNHQLSGAISGSGGITLLNSIAGGGLIIAATNSYTGLTSVNASTLTIAATGQLASQQIVVTNTALLKLSNSSSLAQTVTLSIADGGAKIDIPNGVTQTVTALYLGSDGKPELIGTWGHSTSDAVNKDDVHFTATSGKLRVLTGLQRGLIIMVQ
jgi:fibronectin-binding autotransporter adhesin